MNLKHWGMDKLVESDAKSKAEQHCCEILIEYLKNLHRSELEEVNFSHHNKEVRLQEQNNNFAGQLQSKLSKEESTHNNREAQLHEKRWLTIYSQSTLKLS